MQDTCKQMAEAPRRSYCVITPCRDEAPYLGTTIRTVVAQTIPPARWVLVDDGSTDATPEILQEAASDHDFIHVVRRADRGARRVGAGVIQAFYAGLACVDLDEYEYVCKLDADLDLPPRYFQHLIEEMEKDPALGTVSGKIYLRDPSGRVSHERRGDENSVGPSKFYRVSCFRDIGGFVEAAGWDGVDGHMCRLKGWIAKSMDAPELRAFHLRMMGSSEKGILTGRMRSGAGRWFIGSSLPYMAAMTLYRLFEPPYVIGGLSILFGYLRAMLRREPRFGDEVYRRSLRRFERNALARGKRRALAIENRRIRELRMRAGPANRPADRTG